MATLDAVLATIDKNIDASTQRLFDLLRIPSVSTDPAYTKECERAADWLVRELQGLGYRAESRPTPGHPIVVGHANAKRKDAPHLLFYGITTCSRPIRWSYGRPSPSRRVCNKARGRRRSSRAAPPTIRGSS
jgi:hypothetical protein